MAEWRGGDGEVEVEEKVEDKVEDAEMQEVEEEVLSVKGGGACGLFESMVQSVQFEIFFSIAILVNALMMAFL